MQVDFSIDVNAADFDVTDFHISGGSGTTFVANIFQASARRLWFVLSDGWSGQDTFHYTGDTPGILSPQSTALGNTSGRPYASDFIPVDATHTDIEMSDVVDASGFVPSDFVLNPESLPTACTAVANVASDTLRVTHPAVGSIGTIGVFTLNPAVVTPEEVGPG